MVRSFSLYGFKHPASLRIQDMIGQFWISSFLKKLLHPNPIVGRLSPAISGCCAEKPKMSNLLKPYLHLEFCLILITLSITWFLFVHYMHTSLLYPEILLVIMETPNGKDWFIDTVSSDSFVLQSWCRSEHFVIGQFV